jgi:two-component system nitrate/nitrite response regulator NarP
MVVSGGSMSGEWFSVLTPREREVALLVARGLANKEVARHLGLTQGTVKLHVHNIFLKLGMRKRYTLIYLMGDQRANASAPAPTYLKTKTA